MPDPKTSAQTWWEVAEFLHAEADLLDSRDYEAWLGLLDDDFTLRMPLARNVRRDQIAYEYTDEGQAAWFDEGVPTLRQRVAQLRTGIHWAEEPASRVSHLITNIRVAKVEQGADGQRQLHVRSRFLVHQNRGQTENNQFIGKREDVLKETPEGFRLLQRRVFLDQTVLSAKALTVFF